MKKIKMKTFATGVVACVILLASCKKGDMGPAGTAGANGSNGVVPTMTDGFIKGNLSGTRQDGTAFNEAFDFDNYWGTPSATLDSNNAASYDFKITRSVDIFGANTASIQVNTSTKTGSTGIITLSNFMFSKSLGTNKKFEFILGNSPAAAITGLMYNAGTGLFTGSFSFTVTGGQNSTGNAATISGSFQATVTQMYHMVSHNDTGSLSN